jgi:PEP-CTERM motif
MKLNHTTTLSGVNQGRFLASAALLVAVALITATPVMGDVVPFSTTENQNYLLIGMGPVNSSGGQPGVGQAVNVNNFELGANKAPVPSTSGFLNGGSSGGPGLLGNVPNIPLNAQVVASGIGGRGNVAITHAGGVFNLQDVGVYGDIGVRTAQSASGADVGTQNSFFNDPNMFPNTFTSTGLTNPGVNNNTGGTGTDVNPGAAVQSTRMDDPNLAGVTGNYNFNPLMLELNSATSTIPGLAQTGVLNVSGSGGVLNSSMTYNLSPGLNVIDILTGSNDFSLNNANLVINGPANAVAIFRVPDHANFLISNGNILVGNGGIGLNSVLFYSDRTDNSQHFNFNNTILNGVAFWTMARTGGAININNAQGCTQLVADKIALNDVRFNRCSFTPEPGSLALLGVAMVGMISRRSRNRSA